MTLPRSWMRLLLVTGVSLCVAVDATGQDDRAAPLPLPAAADSADTDAPKLAVYRVSDSCYVAQHSSVKSNAGFVVGKKSVLVVDCFESSDLARVLLREIRRITPLPVSHVALTNWRYDHSVGNQVFGRDVPILAATESAERLEKRLKADRLLLGASGMHGSLDITKVRYATERIDREKTLDLGGLTVRLMVAGSCSSAGDLVVHVPAENAVFTGDLVWNGLHPDMAEGSSFQWIAALGALQKLGVEKVAPGRGAVGDKQLLVTQLRYLMSLRQLVKHLAKREIDIEEIVKGLTVLEEHADYGFAGSWPTNVRYVHGEIVEGR